ncbi:hypothetical protein ACIQCR_32980 [Streptomyces sp. NPDC093249]|uniref:hypothetical protein n=1 Tax=Streptomyces sp. NPDC093249 TaxID=3366035 RepID=UPI00380AADB8
MGFEPEGDLVGEPSAWHGFAQCALGERCEGAEASPVVGVRQDVGVRRGSGGLFLFGQYVLLEGFGGCHDLVEGVVSDREHVRHQGEPHQLVVDGDLPLLGHGVDDRQCEVRRVGRARAHQTAGRLGRHLTLGAQCDLTVPLARLPRQPSVLQDVRPLALTERRNDLLGAQLGAPVAFLGAQQRLQAGVVRLLRPQPLLFPLDVPDDVGCLLDRLVLRCALCAPLTREDLRFGLLQPQPLHEGTVDPGHEQVHLLADVSVPDDLLQRLEVVADGPAATVLSAAEHVALFLRQFVPGRVHERPHLFLDVCSLGEVFAEGPLGFA